MSSQSCRMSAMELGLNLDLGFFSASGIVVLLSESNDVYSRLRPSAELAGEGEHGFRQVPGATVDLRREHGGAHLAAREAHRHRESGGGAIAGGVGGVVRGDLGRGERLHALDRLLLM